MLETAIENKPVVLTDWTYNLIKEKILNLGDQTRFPGPYRRFY